MRVQARRALLIDSAIGLALAVASWMASFYVWAGSEYGRPDWRQGPPRHMVTIVDPSPWVLPAVLIVALGVATRRIWPRAAFVATVAGVGIYLAAGAMFPPIFLGPALAVYAMASGASIFTALKSAGGRRRFADGICADAGRIIFFGRMTPFMQRSLEIRLYVETLGRQYLRCQNRQRVRMWRRAHQQATLGNREEIRQRVRLGC